MNSQRKDKTLWLKSITVMLIAVLCFLAILCGNAKSAMADVALTYKNQVINYLNSNDYVYYDNDGNRTYVKPVYRLYNNVSSEHLFTTDKTEYDNLLKLTKEGKSNWIGEDINWYSVDYGKVLYDTEGKQDGFYYSDASSKCKAVYRLYNPALGAIARCSHYYTSDEKEITKLCNNYGWQREKIAFWSYGDTPIYTAYSEALGSQHHYTSSKSEWQGLDGGWDKESKKNSNTGFFGAAYAPVIYENTSNHTHTWTPVKSTIHQDAVIESTPNIVMEEHSFCSGKDGCGKDITDDPWGHLSEHLLKHESTSFYSTGIPVQKGYNYTTIYPEYTGGVIYQYRCTCGLTKN